MIGGLNVVFILYLIWMINNAFSRGNQLFSGGACRAGTLPVFVPYCFIHAKDEGET